MLHDSFWREGLFHANAGGSAFDCPYSKEHQPAERMKWMNGFTLGLQQRRMDVLHGRNSDLTARAEFSVERGRRAGKSIVGRSS